MAFVPKRRFNFNFLYVIGAIFFISWAAFFKMISPGYVGIVVNLFGEKKGADPEELTVGMHWIAPWKTVYSFPVFMQNYTWDGGEGFLFQTAEGLNVSADIGLSYHLNEEEVYLIFCKYRKGIDEITNLFIKNYARDAINKVSSKMKVEELYGTEKEGFIDEVQNHLRRDLEPLGIVIDRLYLIGTLHFPQQVVTALNSKIEATQRAQQRENELREAKAQAEKDIAKSQGIANARLIEAQAEAKANNLISASLTHEILSAKAIEQWDGRLPLSMGGGALIPYEFTPFLNRNK